MTEDGKGEIDEGVLSSHSIEFIKEHIRGVEGWRERGGNRPS